SRVDKNAAADHAVVGNGFDRALLQPADRGLGIEAVVQLIPVPRVPQGVVLCSPLWVHDNDIVGILEPAGEGLRAPADVEAFVVSQGVDRLRPNRMQWV